MVSVRRVAPLLLLVMAIPALAAQPRQTSRPPKNLHLVGDPMAVAITLLASLRARSGLMLHTWPGCALVTRRSVNQRGASSIRGDLTCQTSVRC